MFDGLDARRRGEVGFVRARAADKDDVVGVLQEFAAMELAHERLVDFADGEVEAVKVTILEKQVASSC